MARNEIAAGVRLLVSRQARQRVVADLGVPLDALLAEQRRQYVELDADSACCLPGLSCPACPPAGTVPPGGASWPS